MLGGIEGSGRRSDLCYLLLIEREVDVCDLHSTTQRSEQEVFLQSFRVRSRDVSTATVQECAQC